MLPLATAYCRKLCTGVIQYAYMCIQATAIDEHSIAAAMLPLATAYCRKLCTGVIQYAYMCIQATAIDEHSIAAAMLPLATAYCRKLCTGVIQYAYMCIQATAIDEHSIAAAMLPLATAYCRKLCTGVIQYAYCKTQATAYDEHSIAAEILPLATAYCRKLCTGVIQYAYMCIQATAIDEHSIAAAMLPLATAYCRKLCTGVIQYAYCKTQATAIDEHSIAAAMLPLATAYYKQRELIAREQSTLYSQAIHYANRMVYLLLPLDGAGRRAEARGDDADRASNSITNSVAESDSVDAESGFEEADPGEAGNNVIKMVSRFVCTEGGVTAEHVRCLHQMIPGVVHMHLETLDAVARESRRLPPVQKPRIVAPALVPGEAVSAPALRAYLVSDGRQTPLLPAEGALFLTNYRLVALDEEVNSECSETFRKQLARLRHPEHPLLHFALAPRALPPPPHHQHKHHTLKGFAKKTLLKTARKAGLKPKPSKRQKYVLPSADARPPAPRRAAPRPPPAWNSRASRGELEDSSLSLDSLLLCCEEQHHHTPLLTKAAGTLGVLGRNSGGKGGAAATSSRHFGRWGSLKDRQGRQPSHLELYQPRQRLSTADVDSGKSSTYLTTSFYFIEKTALRSCRGPAGPARIISATISSLAQLCLEPYYRTLEGFRILVEKEWLALGHKFAQRSNIAATPQQGYTPTFLMFLDCVHQLLKQFPLAFEFNDYYLRFVAYHAVSCRFRTFLLDSESQRAELGITAADDKRADTNRLVLRPVSSICSLEVWQYYTSEELYDNISRSMPDAFSGLLERIRQLELELGHLPQKWRVRWDQLELPNTLELQQVMLNRQNAKSNDFEKTKKKMFPYIVYEGL
ncbi:Myotubularin-related protein 13 [Operophtera brumata]|uniref:Myotubularin-related protein 13 n=1 Tax=Operophtera brumata TaxID=104452 RepID=A0A0L7LQP1_OPEBR|nr:Myotubularin-related protein 13 [Operophtera brumata]